LTTSTSEVTTVNSAMQRLIDQNAAEKIWAKDSSLWALDEHHSAVILNRLGWLDSVSAMVDKIDDITHLADKVRADDIETVVLLGMGGSSLCPDVLSRTFGPGPGFPRLHVLDSTDPDAIADIEEQLDLNHTLFVVATKSGGTTETISFFEYFWDRAKPVLGDEAGSHFIAITDPGSSLETLASERGFRRTFLNPADIGGRYSAISFFGLVPAALLGIDLTMFLSRAATMADLSRVKPSSSGDLTSNPALALGAFIAANASSGRDKLTLVFDHTVEILGAWIEQLIAESLGKNGKGAIPIAGETLGDPSAYGNDRAFVTTHLAGTEIDPKIMALEAAGHPVHTIHISDEYDLGAEFFRWEFATAVAGALLGVDPFDEPNVTESKENTKRYLQTYIDKGSMPTDDDHTTDPSDHETLNGYLSQLNPGDYLAIQAYLETTDETTAALQKIRMALRDKYKVATTLGWGPRFLHSTGQLHKGGPASGVFLQITHEDLIDLDIPGQDFGFSELKEAQAKGDLDSLTSKNLRALSVYLSQADEADMDALVATIIDGLS